MHILNKKLLSTIISPSLQSPLFLSFFLPSGESVTVSSNSDDASVIQIARANVSVSVSAFLFHARAASYVFLMHAHTRALPCVY